MRAWVDPSRALSGAGRAAGIFVTITLSPRKRWSPIQFLLRAANFASPLIHLVPACLAV